MRNDAIELIEGPRLVAPKAEPELVVTPPSVVVDWNAGEGLIAALSNENSFEPWPERPVFSLQFARQDAHVVVAVEGELDADSASMLHQRLSDLMHPRATCRSSSTFVPPPSSTRVG